MAMARWESVIVMLCRNVSTVWAPSGLGCGRAGRVLVHLAGPLMRAVAHLCTLRLPVAGVKGVVGLVNMGGVSCWECSGGHETPPEATDQPWPPAGNAVSPKKVTNLFHSNITSADRHAPMRCPAQGLPSPASYFYNCRTSGLNHEVNGDRLPK